jgi:3-methyl-2-oxobutanoate hydroxymethyltransferase
MSEPLKRITVPAIRATKKVRRLAMLTAYDCPSAQIVDRSGADIVLVGDSLAMVVLGHPDTLSVTVDEMLHHTRAAARGTSRALLVGDMPWLSYHLSLDETVRNAAGFIRAGAQAVKIEGGRPSRIARVRAILDAEIPVMGHIGLTPQSVNVFGGFKVQGKGADAAKQLMDEAMALDDAGCFAIVLECVPAELAAWITDSVSVPTIGIGAGPACDGQVLVFHDLLGLYDGHTPKFVRRYAEAGKTMGEAVARFVADVQEGRFPDAGSESFHVSSDDDLRRLYASFGAPA